MRRVSALIGMLALLVTGLQAQTSPAHVCGNALGMGHFESALKVWHAESAARGASRFSRPPAVSRKASGPVSTPEIGDRLNFRVYLWNANNWASREFELRDKTDLYYAWVEVANLAQVTESELNQIRTAMMDQTPSGSINPAAGVIENQHALFGDPPDVDGDGVVDFLFYDIDNPNVGGFVSPEDLTQDQRGNLRDVLHLDVFQSASFLPRLIAHEYVHLIHFNYQFDVETFISEGLAEFGMVANGYTQDGFTYLAYPTEHKRGLFSWRGIDEDNVGRDYDRARLFFSYLAERMGPQAAASILRSPYKGAAGVDTVLAGQDLRLGPVIADFHTANWVFDTTLSPEFGYRRHFSAPLGPVPDIYFDTSLSNFTPEAGPEDRPTLEGGAVNYIHWNELADLKIEFDAYVPSALEASQPQLRADLRARLRARLIATRDDESLEVLDIAPGSGRFDLIGNFHEVTMMVTSIDPIKQARYATDGSWRAFGKSTGTEGLAGAPEVSPGESPGLQVEAPYPNPAISQASISWTQHAAGSVTVSVLDLLGRNVLSLPPAWHPAGRRSASLDLGALASGAYFVVLSSAGSRSVQPLAVAR